MTTKNKKITQNCLEIRSYDDKTEQVRNSVSFCRKQKEDKLRETLKELKRQKGKRLRRRSYKDTESRSKE